MTATLANNSTKNINDALSPKEEESASTLIQGIHQM